MKSYSIHQLYMEYNEQALDVTNNLQLSLIHKLRGIRYLDALRHA
jgi:hypothetical protein